MELIKKFTVKKDILKFKKEYSNGNIQTEVISNFYNYQSQSEEARNFTNFFYNNDKFHEIFYVVSSISELALTETFGKYDFTFEGNRLYKNWILSFQENIFIVPAKREVVLLKGITEEVINKSIQFEKEFMNFCIHFALNNKNKVIPIHLKILENFEKIGIIRDNKIKYDFFQSNKLKL
jgi:hypothetical protein